MNTQRMAVLWTIPLWMLSSCGVFGAPGQGPASIETLLGHVEQVRVEAQGVREETRAAMEQLQVLATQPFDQGAMAKFHAFTAAVDSAQQRAGQLNQSAVPMLRAAPPVFDRWAEGLTEIHSSAMRRRSQVRLDQSRAKYDAIERALDAAQNSLQKFNQGLHDHQLFLDLDFNAQSVASIQGDVQQLSQLAQEVDSRMELCQTAARLYTDSVALPSPVGAASPGR